MACASCSGTNGVSKGCGNKGHCASGSCNKLNTFDWLSKREVPLSTGENIVEVSFKNGASKEFYYLNSSLQASTGEMVVVNSGNGYDIGRISLMGDLVSLQMKKKKVNVDRIEHNVIRIANQRDLEKLTEARNLEIPAMIKARAIARSMEIEMKLGDVQYQGDKRKATFYYTAEGRVDFRELVRAYAKDFRVKIEMKQIGSRQESARIGGIGSCGRELCCSTWLTDFKSVSTTAARYQYMAINQSKLSGQCGRLKCCLNYELDNYMDALSGFPEKADYLKTENGSAKLMKIDIFKGIMYYSVFKEKGRSLIVPIDKEDVKKVVEMNKKGEFPESILALQHMAIPEDVDDFQDYEDVTGAVELPDRKKKRRSGSGRKGSGNSSRGKNSRGKKPISNKEGETNKPTAKGEKSAPNPRNKKRRGPRKGKPSQQSGADKADNKQNISSSKPTSNGPKDGTSDKPVRKRPNKRKPKANNKPTDNPNTNNKQE